MIEVRNSIELVLHFEISKTIFSNCKYHKVSKDFKNVNSVYKYNSWIVL